MLAYSEMKNQKPGIILMFTILIITSLACGSSTESLPTLMPRAYVPGTEPTPTNWPTETQWTVTTDNGTFDIPGTGYLDGRDPEASPPLTIMIINVRERITGPRPALLACKLKHGMKVELLDVQQDPAREETFYKFKIRHGTCEGWVSWWFVNTGKYDPVGERIYDN